MHPRDPLARAIRSRMALGQLGEEGWVRMWSTLRAPLSTSVQRPAIAVDQLLAVGQLGVVAVPDPLADPGELELDDLADLALAQRIVGHHRQPAQEGRPELLQQRRPHLLDQPSGLRAVRRRRGRARAITSVPTFEVSRITVFLKSISTPLAVLQRPLVEDLEEELRDVRVGLLDLVEQHDASRACAAPPR